MTLKVYGPALYTSTSRVLATFFEKNVDDYVIENVDMDGGAHKRPEFLKLQPFAMIPVLQDDDFYLYESRAIARYVAEKFEDQGTPLLGTTVKERALVNQWLEVESQNFNPPVSTLVWECVFGPYHGSPTDEKVVAAQLQKLEKVLDVYEAHLAQNKYLAGDFYSLADLSHLPYAHHLIHVAKKGDGMTSRKHVNAWWEDISSRPSWQKVLALRAK